MANTYLTGYIEGYYGRMLRWEERLALVKTLATSRGGAYLYAPKEDPYHRQEWRKAYSIAWQRAFAKWVKASRKLGVEVIPGIAPGLSFDYESPSDFKALVRKLKTFLELGCQKVALLMDDIPDRLPPKSERRFSSLGEAHGKLLKNLAAALSMKAADLWFCPTVYCDGFAKNQVKGNRYLLDLARTAPLKTPLMWTGPGIISGVLDSQNLKPLTQIFGSRILLWDNYYANDYCPQKLFVGPLQGRNHSLLKSTQGLLLNATGLPETDVFLLRLLGDWRERKPSLQSWQHQIRSSGVPPEFFKVAAFLSSPFFDTTEKKLTHPQVLGLRKALKPLIWNWKSPLQSEWYPYLFMLDADLKAVEQGKEKPDPLWIRKRYSPILAHLLLGRPQAIQKRVTI